MSSQNPGTQSPPAEDQYNGQKAPPSSGQNVGDKPNTEQSAKDQLKGLESNPRGVLEDHLEESFKKTMPQKKD